MTLDPPTPDTDQEPATRCVHCPRLLHADELDRWACRVCEDRAREQVTDLAAWHPQLRAKLIPGSSGGDSAGHVTGATRSAPLPVSLAALDLVGPGGIVSQLQTIEDDWRRTLGWTIAPFRGGTEQTLAAVAPFLINNLPWACGMYEDVADDLRLVARLHSRVDTIVNGVRESRVPIGCCPISTGTGDDEVPCGEPLRVSPFALYIRCAGCGTRWDRDQWLRLGAAMRGLPSPVTAVA